MTENKRFDGLFKTYSINEGYVTVSEKEIDDVIKQLNELHEENKKLKDKIKKLETKNKAQSDAIDGLQGFITHFDLEELDF